MPSVRQPEETRLKILESALDLFHRGSFTGTSINQIVEKAGITKGALFHYFRGKNELGYAVVDECLASEIQEAWIEPLATSVNPASDIMAIVEGQAACLKETPEMIELGCPLNNLAQEMSTLDESFRLRLLALYEEWEGAIEKSILAGIDAGNVRSDIDPKASAVTLVALLEGCIGLIKVHRSLGYVGLVVKGLNHFLESLRP